MTPPSPPTVQIPFQFNIEPISDASGEQLRFTFGVPPVIVVQVNMPLQFGETVKELINKARREMPRIKLVPGRIVQ
jgi:hypothetical protein